MSCRNFRPHLVPGLRGAMPRCRRPAAIGPRLVWNAFGNRTFPRSSSDGSTHASGHPDFLEYATEIQAEHLVGDARGVAMLQQCIRHALQLEIGRAHV